MNTKDDIDDQQRWIDDLLRRGATDAWETPPDSLRESFRTKIALHRRRTRLLACGLAAAAMLLFAAGWIVLYPPQDIAVAQQDIAVPSNKTLSPEAVIPHAATNRATFVSNGDAIAIPVESTSADVTIVQLYPTTETELRLQLDLALQATYSDSNGG